jgi:hypothetical protein
METLMYKFDVADPPTRTWAKSYRRYSDQFNAWYQTL